MTINYPLLCFGRACNQLAFTQVREPSTHGANDRSHIACAGFTHTCVPVGFSKECLKTTPDSDCELISWGMRLR